MADYLSSSHASSYAVEGINYIKITGTIPPEDLRDYIYPSSGGRLAKTIQYAHKKVALKLPDSIPELTTMYNCFTKCEYLVSLEKIPSGVTSMKECFQGCTALTKAPVIPDSVNNMEHCFHDCKALTEAPDIPSGVTDISQCFQGCTALTRGPDIPSRVGNMYQCFQGCTNLQELKLMCNYDGQFTLFSDVFDGCTALMTGGIQVPQNQLTAYQDGADNMKTTREKFSGF